MGRAPSLQELVPAQRRDPAMEQLLPEPSFEAWRLASGESPPDFARLPARTGLWSPVDGVEHPGQWPARRRVLQARWRRWLTGTLPAPGPLQVCSSTATRAGVERRRLVVRGAGPAGAWSLRAELLRPAGSRELPVYLLVSSHRGWAEQAVARGLAACLVSAADGDDDSVLVSDAHPDVVAGRLAWRAWALARVLDALADQPAVDPRRVVVGGHSRNGKAALLLAAFDPRVAGVVSSSSGVLGVVPARLCTDRHFGEGVELLTRHYPDWYHPRLRFFAGREHRLPTDAHELLALAAPRPVLVQVGVQDPVERVPAVQAAVDSAGDAWALLGAAGALQLAVRPGGHTADEAAVAAQLDWVQEVVGDRRRTAVRVAAPAPRAVPWPAPPRRPVVQRWTAGELRSAVRLALGPADAAAAEAQRTAPLRVREAATRADGGEALVADPGGLEVVLLRGAGIERGLVLWLGPPCAATGWRAGYEQDEPLPEQLAAAGWAVACHDPVSSGARHAERPGPGGSPLGRRVADAAHAARVASLTTGHARPWVAAYGSGALVALHLAALDAVPLAGAALVAPTCGEPLLRSAPAYSLADLLTAVADVPAVVLDPAEDPHAPRGAVAAACRAAGVPHVGTPDWHRLSPDARRRVVGWLDEQQA